MTKENKKEKDKEAVINLILNLKLEANKEEFVHLKNLIYQMNEKRKGKIFHFLNENGLRLILDT
jgi:hypothetical protein